MSKQAILAIQNVNLFKVAQPKEGKQPLQFSVSKDKKVNADFSFYDKEKGIDVRGIRVAGDKAAGKKGYIKVAFAIKDGDKTSYMNGALFGNEKKADGQPDLTGTLTIGDEKLRLAAWKKVGEKAGDYLSIRISEYQKAEASQAPEVPAEEPKAVTVKDDDLQDCPF